LTIHIFQLEVEGKPALGFDTGLDAPAFAQAKMAQFITQPGILVFPDGNMAEWKASGVIEYRKADERPTMVIWGPSFTGERLDLLLEDDSRKDETLKAVRFWIEACLSAAEREVSVRPGGAVVSPAGAVLFPPERLVTRCLQAEGDERRLRGESYIHPDLWGKDAAAFTAAAMLYRIFAGAPPFFGGDEEALHQNIREGVFLPVHLAAPGLDKKTADLINAALESGKKDGGPVRRPDPVLFRDCLDRPPEAVSPGGAAAFFQPLGAAEPAASRRGAARFWNKKNAAVHTRRFVIRNTALILGIAAAALLAVLIGRGIAEGQAALPTTAGMDSVQVVRAYYNAFGALDHQMMDAAAIGKAGKGDIEMVTNFFVISRVRQAYEYTSSPVIAAQEWREAGSPPVNSPVFGVSDLELEKISGDEEADEIRYRASYTLWIPASSDEGAAGTPDQPSSDQAAPVPPAGYSYADDLTLTRHKGNWRISEISRK
jgi:hypothetical protein